MDNENNSIKKASNLSEKYNHNLKPTQHRLEPSAQPTTEHRRQGTQDESPQATLSISPTELNRLEVAARTNAEQEVELVKVRAELDSLIHYTRSIQNEVERNYLEAQAQKAINTSTTRKIANVIKNYPEVILFEDIQLHASKGLRWIVEGLERDGRQINNLDLEIKILDDEPRLLVRLNTQIGHPFSDSLVTSNPDKLSDGRLIITPSANVGDAEYLTLRMLSSNELCALDDALYLANRFLYKNSSNAQSATIEKMKSKLKELPKTFRFHNATINGQAIIPAYESLQFSLNNASYGERHWENFSFKLAATRSRGMLTQPRLQFYLLDEKNKPFENWFVESSDQLGERLELRFDTSAEVFDAVVWNKLSAVDQIQLLSIISRLPILLDMIPISNESTSLNLSDWKVLVFSMQKILLKHGLPSNTFDVV
jgi:hypothetical protein